MPKLPAIAARLDARQARWQCELDVTKEKVSKLRVIQSITDYGLRELRKEADVQHPSQRGEGVAGIRIAGRQRRGWGRDLGTLLDPDGGHGMTSDHERYDID